ncbi:MAG TPA: hypothetical protein VM074_09800 [Solimonas sp.]|nr:hypothetical protein [Solimonas sp.]
MKAVAPSGHGAIRKDEPTPRFRAGPARDVVNPSGPCAGTAVTGGPKSSGPPDGPPAAFADIPCVDPAAARAVLRAAA